MDTTTDIELDAWLKLRATETGLGKQREWLASTLDVCKATVDNWCQGKSVPAPPYTEAIRTLSGGRVTAEALHRKWRDRRQPADGAGRAGRRGAGACAAGGGRGVIALDEAELRDDLDVVNAYLEGSNEGMHLAFRSVAILAQAVGETPTLAQLALVLIAQGVRAGREQGAALATGTTVATPEPPDMVAAHRVGHGQVCRICRCTDGQACVTFGRPCHWVEMNLCSACAPGTAGVQ